MAVMEDVGMLRSRKGFTLVELLIVMAVFVIVMMITTDAFKTILTQASKLTRSEESNIEGVLGLEMLRHDLQQSGYGLPYEFLSLISYPEAAGTPSSTYNDGTGDTSSDVPRAVVAGNNLTATAGTSGTESTTILANTDYLTIKGTTLGMNEAAQKWTYMPYSSAVTGKKKVKLWQTNNLTTSDRVIVLKKTYSGNAYTNQLIFNPANSSIYWAAWPNPASGPGFADPVFDPTLKEEIYYLYGIKTGDPLRMPFNRADYFVARPTTPGRIPNFCAPNTGILYKGVVKHDNGQLDYVPLLDCVADMQVVFGWDVDDGMGNEGQDGLVDSYTSPWNSSNDVVDAATSASVAVSTIKSRVKTAMANPAVLRRSLKIIKIYMLAQVGRRDATYQSAASFVLGDPSIDGISSTYNLDAAMRNYHWKVYRIVVRPKNLVDS